MDRTLFRKEMEQVQEENLVPEKVMRDGIRYFNDRLLPQPYGIYNLRIAIEEFAELMDAITDSLLNIAYDPYAILEELADVILSCQMMGILFGKLHRIKGMEGWQLEEPDAFGRSGIVRKLECIKHLSVLSMSLSKYLRDPKPQPNDHDELIGQINRVLKAVESIAAIEHFTKEDVEKAVTIKLKRLERNISRSDYY